MRRIKNKDLASLLMQLRYTPQSKRRDQLAEAEKLFDIIRPDKEYPFEFIHFRIIGFHPNTTPDQPVVIGDEILDDLSIFISKLSDQIADPVDTEDGPVHTIEQLAETLGVSRKTIQRWRTRGLIARKSVFSDGRKRLAFRQSAVDKFIADHPDLIGRAKSFERVTEPQKQHILKLIRKLALVGDMSRHRIIDSVATETSRAHETVRCILKEHEKAHPESHIFDRPAGPLSAADAAELYRLYKQDTSIKELMHRFGRSRSSIYRVVNIRRAKALLAKKIEFVPSSEFETADQQQFLAEALPPPVAQQSVSPDNFRKLTTDLAAESLPRYLHTLKSTPTLNRDAETALFRRYNYTKYLIARKRPQLKKPTPSSALLDQIEDYLTQADDIRNHLIEANLRLVVGIARKHTSSTTANMVDLVSEGNLSLVRAVEKFDYTKGFRFGTYASWTISKDFARKIPAETSRPDQARGELFDHIQQDLPAQASEDLATLERAHRSLADVITSELDEREQFVILNRFGPIGEPIRKKTRSLREVGEDLGLTKERIRQIELTALQKLRQCLSTEEFELLTGLP